MKKDLKEDLLQLQEKLKNYSTFKSLWSKDEGEKTLAELYRLTLQVELLIDLNELKDVEHPKNKCIQEPLLGKSGSLVSIRPVGKEYEGKTFVGFLVGEVALSSSITISNDKIQCNWAMHNPAIFVPELSKIIYGAESWWGEIKSVEDFKTITDQDIENVWYVKLWKEMNNPEK